MKDQVLIDGLKKLSRDIADLASALEGNEEVYSAEAPSAELEPAKQYTYEEVRAVLAEKARTGFRAEVKAILTSHGVKQLSDVSDPAVLAEIMSEAEGIGNA